MQDSDITEKLAPNVTEVCYIFVKMTFLLFLLIIQLSCGSAAGGTTSSDVSALATFMPDNGISAVPTSSPLKISFNRKMDASTITPSTLLVSGPDGVITGTVSYDSTMTATFVPLAPLMPQANYTVTLTTAIKDATGKVFANNKTWNFTTGRDALARPASDVIPSTFFGQHIHRADSTTAWPTIPFGSWRLWDAGVVWLSLEPNKDGWHFDKLDKDVSLAEQHNVEVILPLGMPPAWASARPTEKGAFGSGSNAEPGNIIDWRNYVKVVANRYKGRIHFYELWNEVNTNSFYSGSVDEMVVLAREANTILKSIDPSITFISPSCVAYDWRLAWFQEYLAKGGGKYADVIGYHFYVDPQPPESMVPFISTIRKTIHDNNVNKPLWNTETGWYIDNSQNTTSPGHKVLTEDEASAYIARAYILNWAAGIGRFYWYAWDNANMGLLEPDGKTVRPAATAYQQTFYWLTGAHMVSCGTNSQGTWVAKLIKDNGKLSWIVWNPDHTVSMAIPQEWHARKFSYLNGSSQKADGASSLSVGPMPVLVEM